MFSIAFYDNLIINTKIKTYNFKIKQKHIIKNEINIYNTQQRSVASSSAILYV